MNETQITEAAAKCHMVKEIDRMLAEMVCPPEPCGMSPYSMRYHAQPSICFAYGAVTITQQEAKEALVVKRNRLLDEMRKLGANV